MVAPTSPHSKPLSPTMQPLWLTAASTLSGHTRVASDTRRQIVLTTPVPRDGRGQLSRDAASSGRLASRPQAPCPPACGRRGRRARASSTGCSRSGRRRPSRTPSSRGPICCRRRSRSSCPTPGSTPGTSCSRRSAFPTTPPSTEASGPLIVDRNGQPLWFRPLTGRTAIDLRVQRYRGAPVLTWWEGTVFGGYGGTFVIADASYARVARVKAGNGYKADLHEILITSRNTALISIYNEIRTDLSRVGGPVDGRLVEGVIQEIDIPSGACCSSGTASTTSRSRSPSSSPSPATATSTTSISTRSASTPTGTCSSRPGTPPPSTRCTGARASDLAPRRQAERLRARPRCLVRLPARRSPPLRRDADDLRQRRLPAHATWLPRGRCAQARDVREEGLARARLRRRPSSARRGRWATPSRSPTAVSSSAGARIRASARSGRTEHSVRRALRRHLGELSGASATVDRAAGDTSRGRHAQSASGSTLVYASWNGATEVARWQVRAGSSPSGAANRFALFARRGFETAIALGATPPVRRRRRVRPRGALLSVSQPVQAWRRGTRLRPERSRDVPPKSGGA